MRGDLNPSPHEGGQAMALSYKVLSKHKEKLELFNQQNKLEPPKNHTKTSSVVIIYRNVKKG